MSLSVVALQPPSAIFREEQRFGWWTYALLGLMVGLTWYFLMDRGRAAIPAAVVPHRDFSGLLIPGLGLPFFLVVGVLHMSTLVTPTEVRVWFGWVPTYRRSIPIATIRRVEVVQYRPWTHCWGWGIRHGRDGERVLNARGDRGVRLHLVDGTRLLIGSQRPEELALAVEGSLRPGG